MKKIILLIVLCILTIYGHTQGFNEDKTALINFIKRMYTAAPFEGVKIVDDYEHQYLLSVISLEKVKYANPSIMNRVAQVKAQSQANTFLNGASISMDMVIKTTEQKSNDSINVIVETIESIKQNSTGFSQGLELLTNFENTDSKCIIFIFYIELKKTLNNENK